MLTLLGRGLLAAIVLALLLPAAGGQAAPAVAAPFRAYYDRYAGPRTYGPPIGDLFSLDGLPAQYFEKGRLEDHRASVADPIWGIMGGRLTVELMERDPNGAVNNMGITYAALAQAAAPRWRVAPPAGFTGGTLATPGGQFVPIDPFLRPAPGHIVAPRFWEYLNRADLFPAGWLHDVGLPLTPALTVETYKSGELREITYQAFERSVLTDDPQNPPAWRVERGNLGLDAQRTLPSGGAIQIPVAGARVTLPLHILARVGEPGQSVVARLRWVDGTERRWTLPVLRGEDGRGLVIGTPPWWPDQPPQPGTQAALLQLETPAGAALASQAITVLGINDPATQLIEVYWTVSGSEQIVAEPRRIVRTPAIGTAALEELLWGPPPASQIGYGTALPTPAEVLAYPGRQPDWGPRVTLRSLTIVNGVATADFSRELRAYGGGSARVQAISQQIRRTLLQFPTVRTVRIAIEGQTDGVLEP